MAQALDQWTIQPDDDAAFEAAADQVVDAFAAWLAGRDLEPTDGWIAYQMLHAKWTYGDGALTRWTAADLHEVFLDVLPRKLTVDADDIDRLVPTAARFFEFLDARGMLDPGGEDCAALAARKGPSEELEFAVDLVNRVTRGIDGIRIGLHVCRGNWSRKEDVLLKGNYGPLLPWLMRMNIDQLVLEMATPRAGEIDVFKEYKNQKELGLGVANPRTDNIEDPKSIVQSVRRLLEFYDADKIFLNPDCGLVHLPREVAFSKLTAMAEGTRMVREELKR